MNPTDLDSTLPAGLLASSSSAVDPVFRTPGELAPLVAVQPTVDLASAV